MSKIRIILLSIFLLTLVTPFSVHPASASEVEYTGTANITVYYLDYQGYIVDQTTTRLTAYIVLDDPWGDGQLQETNPFHLSISVGDADDLGSFSMSSGGVYQNPYNGRSFVSTSWELTGSRSNFSAVLFDNELPNHINGIDEWTRTVWTYTIDNGATIEGYTSNRGRRLTLTFEMMSKNQAWAISGTINATRS